MSMKPIGTPLSANATRILFLGSGELCKEMILEAQRLGIETIAVDSYADAPAMQVAHRSHVIDMKDPEALKAVVRREQPDRVVPEIEAIHTDALLELESEGFHIIPTAGATRLTMDREGIRRLAAETLQLPTAAYLFADDAETFKQAVLKIGIPCICKPIMSSSGKGQSTIKSEADIDRAWAYAHEAARGIGTKVIVEAFIDFDYEITLLTVRTAQGTRFCEPIGHIQIAGDYHESWQPCPMTLETKQKAEEVALQITDALGGWGLFGVELFVKGNEVIFSEVSPRPHDTGMVTMITQYMSEFELHIRAILGLPVDTRLDRCGASHVLKAVDKQWAPQYDITEAVQIPNTKIRLFGKPMSKPGRRMGVVLATGTDCDQARKTAELAAHAIKIQA